MMSDGLLLSFSLRLSPSSLASPGLDCAPPRKRARDEGRENGYVLVPILDCTMDRMAKRGRSFKLFRFGLGLMRKMLAVADVDVDVDVDVVAVL